jgi:hypothetical protein
MEPSYKVLHSRELHVLEKVVNKHVSMGYMPQGGIVVAPRYNENGEVVGLNYAQAMFKSEGPHET